MENCRDRYPKDANTFPGKRILVFLSTELDGWMPHQARELKEGYVRMKALIGRHLDPVWEVGELTGEADA